MTKRKEVMISISIEDFNEMQRQLEQRQEIKKEADSKNLLTVDDALKLLKVSRQTLYNWRKAKLIPSHRINSRLYFFEHELLEAVSNLSKKNLSA